MLLITYTNVDYVLIHNFFRAKLFYDETYSHKTWVLAATNYLILNMLYNHNTKWRHIILYVMIVFRDDKFGVHVVIEYWKRIGITHWAWIRRLGLLVLMCHVFRRSSWGMRWPNCPSREAATSLVLFSHYLCRKTPNKCFLNIWLFLWSLILDFYGHSSNSSLNMSRSRTLKRTIKFMFWFCPWVAIAVCFMEHDNLYTVDGAFCSSIYFFPSIFIS